jgi:TolA-binding protein
MSAPSMPRLPSSPRLAAAPLLVSLAALAGAAPAQQPAAKGRPDQVFVAARRGGEVAPVNGIVQKNELEGVVVTVDGKDASYDADRVQRIVWGEVPDPFREGQAWSERKDWEHAAASFRLAAGDESARAPVKAAARLAAAEALLHWGEKEPARFAEAAEEARRFVTDFPKNRELPKARMVEARATLLSGKAAEAGALYRTIYSDCGGDKVPPGYDRLSCLEAGLQAARALLMAKDTLAAREVYASLPGKASAAAAEVPPGDPLRAHLSAIADEASLGEGFAELAAGNAKQAVLFFRPKVEGGGTQASEALRFGATLGLAEALLAEGKAREAQFLFARISALDYTDRDRVARALVRMAEAAKALADPDYKKQAQAWLGDVLERFGDTPWAGRARELLNEIGK